MVGVPGVVNGTLRQVNDEADPAVGLRVEMLGPVVGGHGPNPDAPNGLLLPRFDFGQVKAFPAELFDDIGRPNDGGGLFAQPADILGR